MKSSKLVCLFLLLACSLSAQLRLNVQGDAKISGQLDLSSPGSNMFLGSDSGESITTGQFNTFIGQAVGAFNTEGGSNTFVGVLSGYSNTSGKENTFIGVSTGLANTSGSSNTFLGFSAGRSNTSGSSNTFLGYHAGYSNTSGYQNTFVGWEAGYSNQTSNGSTNTFVGEGAGYNNQDGSSNVFVGRWAGRKNINGRFNAFFGNSAGQDNTDASFNTFLGDLAGYTNTTGDRNTFVGWGAGEPNTTGSDLTAFGALAGASLIENAPVENAFAFGNNALMTQSHSGVLGNLSMQKIGGYVNWGTASDGRMKTQVREDVHGLDFILQLRPVSYQVDALKLDRFLRQGMEEAASRKKDLSAEEKAQAEERRQTYEGYLREKSVVRYTGFIAQEVERAMNASGFEFSGLVLPAHDQDHYSLRYAEFVVPLVKGMQEQQEIIEEQQTKNQAQAQALDRQRREIDNLKTELSELKSLVGQLVAAQQEEPQGAIYDLNLEQKAMLAQNRPNPFSGQTLIDYFIPHNGQKAVIQVTTADGKVLGQVAIREAGKGQVNITTKTYPAGTYFYSLILDGQLFETKRMVLTE